MIKTIRNNWLSHLKQELKETDSVKIISPFVTDNMARHLLESFNGSEIQLITRFNLNDFQSGVSSLKALERLVKNDCKIKGIKSLHSKLYIFDEKSVIITSANFTNGGFFRNKEFGIISYSFHTVRDSKIYFEELWEINKVVLKETKISVWKKEIKRILDNVNKNESLPDYGASYQDKVIVKSKRYFIKIFGKNEHRVNLNYHSKDEIQESHCHYTLSFSRKKNDKRPRKYRNGDIVFMAMMLNGSDYAVFGKGFSYAHDDFRDIASKEDIASVPWRKEWPVLVRVHSTEFINSTMQNCPKMSELIHELDYESFDKTLKRYNLGVAGINPWNSLRQQADVQLSELGAQWLEERFQTSIKLFGKVPRTYIDQFYQGKSI
ncbi:MAG TPA: phospholipase D family protein [Salinimicrobium sp.]|nr:phospholipase D family protein [Salinimicrobium sp.]